MTFHEGQYNMDHNTLMFIVAGQGRQQQPNAYPKRAPNAPLGPCYNCVEEHLIKDCPFPRQPRQVESTAVPMLARHCIECGCWGPLPRSNEVVKARTQTNINMSIRGRS